MNTQVSKSTDEKMNDTCKTSNPKYSERCHVCNKKLGLTPLQCKCSHIFCSAHIFYKDHACSFDFRQHGRSILEKQNPKVVGEKLNY